VYSHMIPLHDICPTSLVNVFHTRIATTSKKETNLVFSISTKTKD